MYEVSSTKIFKWYQVFLTCRKEWRL